MFYISASNSSNNSYFFAAVCVLPITLFASTFLMRERNKEIKTLVSFENPKIIKNKRLLKLKDKFPAKNLRIIHGLNFLNNFVNQTTISESQLTEEAQVHSLKTNLISEISHKDNKKKFKFSKKVIISFIAILTIPSVFLLINKDQSLQSSQEESLQNIIKNYCTHLINSEFVNATQKTISNFFQKSIFTNKNIFNNIQDIINLQTLSCFLNLASYFCIYRVYRKRKLYQQNELLHNEANKLLQYENKQLYTKNKLLQKNLEVFKRIWYYKKI